MNIYEAIGLVLVIGMVVILLIAAHALGQDERTLRRVEQEAARKAEKTGKTEKAPKAAKVETPERTVPRQKSDV